MEQPSPPTSLPKYLAEGLPKQDTETLHEVQAYVEALTEYRERDPSPARRKWYYLGAAGTLWVAWQASTITGVLVGAQVPPGLSLEFAIPLTFLALLVPNVTGRSSALAAGIGGVGTVLGTNLPYDVSLVVAALVGVLAATALDGVLEPATDGEETVGSDEAEAIGGDHDAAADGDDADEGAGSNAGGRS